LTQITRKGGGKRDIENVLHITPSRPLFVAMHDGFNPDCRQGMIEANWQAYPYVHAVEFDFIPGRFNYLGGNPQKNSKMTCGFALALFLPVKRYSDLNFGAHDTLFFNILLKKSSHYRPWWRHIFSSIKRYLLRSMR
jgi:hypothetical protein